MQPLTTALGNYGLTKPLKEGAIKVRVPLDYVAVEPITAAMRRMVRGLDFDICEMAFTTYLCAKALGKPITAIPVFLTRNFHHWAAFAHAESGINSPNDLAGRRVAVNRGYTVTTGLWVRGILQHEYGVDLNRITWLATDEEHVAEYKAPANVEYLRGKNAAELLLSRQCHAAIGDVRTDSPLVKPLIPQAREAGFAYFRKTGVYPINHGVVVKSALLNDNPSLAADLFAAFKQAKAIYLEELRDGRARTQADDQARRLAEVVGDDPFPFGIKANQRAIETIVDFAVEQQVIPRRLSIEELFAAGTLELQ
jgi:ABC-type nitrate/sulfonate/bicarbonate transport system substrate-binding protein